MTAMQLPSGEGGEEGNTIHEGGGVVDGKGIYITRRARRRVGMEALR